MTDSNSPATSRLQTTDTPLVGKYANLEIGELLPMGALLIAGEMGNILLPNKQVPDKSEVGDVVKVFIYLDSEDRVIATCQRPRATVGQAANLRVADVNDSLPKFEGYLSSEWAVTKAIMSGLFR